MKPRPEQLPLLETLRFYVLHRYSDSFHPDEVVTCVYPDKTGEVAYTFEDCKSVLWILSRRWLGLPGEGMLQRPPWALIPRAHEIDAPRSREPFVFNIWDLRPFGVFEENFNPIGEGVMYCFHL